MRRNALPFRRSRSSLLRLSQDSLVRNSRNETTATEVPVFIKSCCIFLQISRFGARRSRAALGRLRESFNTAFLQR